MRKHVNQIREIIAILYEITTFFVPMVFMYLEYKGAISVLTAMFGIFFYLLPVFCHGGIFGDKPKAVADKIMGY